MKTLKPVLLAITTAIFCMIVFMLPSCRGETPGQSETETKAPPEYEGLRTAFYECDYSRGRLVGKAFQPLRAGVESSYIRATPHLGYKFIGWSDGVISATRYGDIIYDDTVITALFDYDTKGFPVLAIDTVNERPINSRDKYVGAAVSVFASSSAEYNIESVPGQIRGRGNATWNIMDKKSYRLQFDEKYNLLGIDTGSAKSWVLLANHCDQSMMRNRIAFQIGNIFDGIECSSSDTFVDLYINGRYNGVYLLCEQVEVQKNRVDIKETADVNSGYLIELDRYYEGEENKDHFWIYKLPYSIKSDTKSPEQVEYIKNYIKSVEDAILSGDRSQFASVADIASCVDMYIIQEFMKNIDAGWSSFFMYIKEDGGKLFFGPPWDFDIAAGNDHRLDNGDWEGIYVGNGNYGFTQSNRWFIELMKTEWFDSEVRQRWSSARDIINNAIGEAEDTGIKYRDAFNRNYDRWIIFGQRINQEPEHVMALNSYTKHLDYFIEWCTNRLEWLDGYFGN